MGFLSCEEASKEEGFIKYDIDGAYQWLDEDDCFHLVMKNIQGEWVDILENKKALFFSMREDGIYSWRDTDGLYHLMLYQNGGLQDVLAGKEAQYAYLYEDNTYKWRDKNNFWHLVINGHDLFEDQKIIKLEYTPKNARFDSVIHFRSRGE